MSIPLFHCRSNAQRLMKWTIPAMSPSEESKKRNARNQAVCLSRPCLNELITLEINKWFIAAMHAGISRVSFITVCIREK